MLRCMILPGGWQHTQIETRNLPSSWGQAAGTYTRKYSTLQIWTDKSELAMATHKEASAR